MKTIYKNLNNNLNVNKYLDIFGYDVKNEEVIFFDIETTGLNVKKSNLYLIGIVYFENDSWNYVQYFGESINDEDKLLKEFDEFTKKYKYICHFNGEHFDIPYINEKFANYFSPVTSNVNGLISLDLYNLVKEYKVHLGIPNCKQKTIETFLNLYRNDKYNGGELIYQYFDYLKTKNSELFANLLLHNAEDLSGMLELLNIVDYIKIINLLIESNFTVEISKELCTLDTFTFKLIFDNISLYKDIIKTLHQSKYTITDIVLCIDADSITISSPITFGRKYHYFKDYQNYFYVKELNMAVHKTVSKMISPEKREKAKSSNCYVSHEGYFIKILGNIDNDLVFKDSNKELSNYLLFINSDNNLVVNEIEIVSLLYDSIKNIGTK